MANINGLLEKYKTIENERFFGDIFVGNEYEAVLDKPARTIIDVGALAGEFGAYMYDKAETIYAIEPYNPYYTELTANIQEFGLEKMKPFNLAIGGENISGCINHDRFRGGNHVVDQDPNAQPVLIKTLATFMREQGITDVDILKIDIEGLEDKVFSAPDFPSIAPHIRLIIGEHLGHMTEKLLSYGFVEIPAGHNNVIYERQAIL